MVDDHQITAAHLMVEDQQMFVTYLMVEDQQMLITFMTVEDHMARTICLMVTCQQTFSDLITIDSLIIITSLQINQEIPVGIQKGVGIMAKPLIIIETGTGITFMMYIHILGVIEHTEESLPGKGLDIDHIGIKVGLLALIVLGIQKGVKIITDVEYITYIETDLMREIILKIQ